MRKRKDYEKEIFQPWLFNSLFIMILNLFFHLFCSLLNNCISISFFSCFLLSLSTRERIQENFLLFFFHSFLSFLSNNIFYIIKLFSLGHKLIKMAKCCITNSLHIFSISSTQESIICFCHTNSNDLNITYDTFSLPFKEYTASNS